MKRTRATVSEEIPAKKKKYDHVRTYQDEPISDEQPLLLSGGIMRDYQLKGYSWMATLYENGINGKYLEKSSHNTSPLTFNKSITSY